MLDFPFPPTDGQTFVAPNGVIYTYQAPPGRWNDAGTIEGANLGYTVTPEDYGAKGNGVAGTDFVTATGTDDTQAFKDAIAYLESLGTGTLSCGAKRYMIDLPNNSQLFANLSNITIRGVPGQTVLDFSRTTGFYNGGAGSDGIVRPNGFIRTAGTKYGSSTAAVTSGVYSTTTGAVVLTMSAPITISAGNTVTLALTGGTGAWQQLNGTYVAINNTGGTTVTVAAATGLGTITITGGTVASNDGGYPLTNDVIASDGIVGMVASGSRSGTTITINTEGAHGLAIGNLVWVMGDPDTTGEDILDDDNVIISTSQSCFFTSKARTMGRTVPVAVASTPTATSFTFIYTGDLTGQDTVLDIRTHPYVMYASDVMSVPDSSIFRRGERVMLGSLDERGRDSEHCNIGEYQEIGKILTPTLIRFHNNVRDSYRVAEGARVFKLSQIVNPTFEGLTIIGKGCNRGVGRGDVAINTTQTHNLVVRNCNFRDCDLMSVYIFYSSKALIEDCNIVQDQRDQAGSESGVLDIQYGINYGACIEDITIQRNTCRGGRHFAVQGGSSADSDFGVARVVRILHNFCTGLWLDPLSTHQSADTLIIDGNVLLANQGGINPRYALRLVITNNIVVATFDAFLLYNDVLNALVKGNLFDAGHYPIQIKSIDNATANVMPDGGTGNSTKLSRPTPAGPSIQITGNQLRNGRNSVYCVDTTPGLVLSGLEITDNSMYRSRYEAILVLVGNGTAASLAIASGTYDNVTGLTTLVLAASDTRLIAQVPFTLSGLTGTGNFAALNGAQKAISPTSTVDTIYFSDTPGNGATTITAGGLILLSTGESYPILSGTYDNATGAATVQTSSGLPNLVIGNTFTLSGLVGTGGVAALNGAQTATAPTLQTTSITFRDTPGNGATTITGGTLALPLGGFTGSISNNRMYDCCLTQSTYQMRFSNAMSVAFNGNRFYGTSSYAYAFSLAGNATTSCEFMGNFVERTLYTREIVTREDVIEGQAIIYSGLAGTGHKTDMFVREDVTIAGGVAAMKFVTTKHLRLRMESGVDDDLVSITGAGLDQELTLSTQATGWNITVKHGIGFELDTNTDKLLNNRLDKMKVIWSDQDQKFVQLTPLMDHA